MRFLMSRNPGSRNYLTPTRKPNIYEFLKDIIKKENRITIDSTLLFLDAGNILEELYHTKSFNDFDNQKLKSLEKAIKSLEFANFIFEKEKVFPSPSCARDILKFNEKISYKFDTLLYMSAKLSRHLSRHTEPIDKLSNLLKLSTNLERKIERKSCDYREREYSHIEEQLKRYLRKIKIKDRPYDIATMAFILHYPILKERSMVFVTKDSRIFVGLRNLCADLMMHFKEYDNLFSKYPLIGYYWKNLTYCRFNSKFLNPRENPLSKLELEEWKSLI